MFLVVFIKKKRKTVKWQLSLMVYSRISNYAAIRGSDSCRWNSTPLVTKCVARRCHTLYLSITGLVSENRYDFIFSRSDTDIIDLCFVGLEAQSLIFCYSVPFKVLFAELKTVSLTMSKFHPMFWICLFNADLTFFKVFLWYSLACSIVIIFSLF